MITKVDFGIYKRKQVGIAQITGRVVNTITMPRKSNTVKQFGPVYKPFSCPICDIRFRYNAELRKHKKTKRHNDRIINLERRYIYLNKITIFDDLLMFTPMPNLCYMCGEQFESKKEFDKHLRDTTM